MKLRLIIDETSATLQPWFKLEEWREGAGWALITSGYEPEVRRVYVRLMAAGCKTTVVEEFDSDQPDKLVTAAQERYNSGSKTPTPQGDIPDGCTSKGSGSDPA